MVIVLAIPRAGKRRVCENGGLERQEATRAVSGMALAARWFGHDALQFIFCRRPIYSSKGA